MKQRKTLSLILLTLIMGFNAASAQEVDPTWSYDSRGWEWSNPETGSYLWLGLRAQTRYSNRVDEPLVSDDLREDGDKGWAINRARYKIGLGIGNHFTAYHEYDLRNGQLLDLRGTWKPHDWLHVRAGQWKTEYNRERIDSSGKQQFVDRSIANYWFTFDRQNGVMLSGRLAAGKAADSSWWLGYLNGNGMNASGDGGRGLLIGRYQWNFTRNVLPFSQSALKRYETAHAGLTLGFATNDSAYTRFSSSGGGSLPGFENGEDNQYRLKQWMQEFAWHKGSWSVQQELHYKKIVDRFSGASVDLWGGYAQLGWFPNERYERVSENLEVAVRFGYVNPDGIADSNDNEELTFATNWFFNGHRNKLTADFSLLNIEDIDGESEDWRFRLQWDLSL